MLALSEEHNGSFEVALVLVKAAWFASIDHSSLLAKCKFPSTFFAIYKLFYVVEELYEAEFAGHERRVVVKGLTVQEWMFAIPGGADELVDAG